MCLPSGLVVTDMTNTIEENVKNGRTTDEGAAQAVALATLPSFSCGPQGGMMKDGVEVGWTIAKNGAQVAL